MAPAERSSAVTAALESGAAEYVPRSVLSTAPAAVVERAVRAAETAGLEDLRDVYDSVSEPLTLHDPETGELVHANRRLCELLDYDRSEIVAMRVADYTADLPGYDQAAAMEIITSATEAGSAGPVEWPLESSDGERVWVEATLRPVTVGGRELVLSTSTDVTDRRRREREYEQIFNGVSDAIAVFDPETGEITDVNESYHELLGYDDLERLRELGIDGLSVTEAGYTGERGRELVRAVAESGDPETVEWQARRRDGERLWLDVTLSPATIGGEQRVLSIQRDVTERVRREREYEQIFNGVPSPIVINDPETGEILSVNDALCELTGYDRETVRELGVEGLSADDAEYSGERARRIVRRVMESGEPETFEWRLAAADGDVRVLEVTGRPAEIGGEPRYVSMTRDVTEQRRREREFEQIFDAVTDVLAVFDPETGELVDINDTFCELTGYDRETILEGGPDVVGATELGYDGEAVRRVVTEVAETGEPARGVEWASRTESGETLWAEVDATPATINGEERVLAVARDVTERRDREERVQVLNRVLRHNLRNDMDAVHGYATAVEETVEDDRVREHARRIRETADSLLELSAKARATERMLRGDDRRRPSPVDRVLETVVDEARDRFDDTEFGVDLADDAADATVEAGVFRLVLRELVENAAEYGDAVAVRAEATPECDGVTVTVTDDGPGIPDHALTPFRAGGETQFEHNRGLGLWLVNWGVRRLGGGVEVDRPADGGTVVRLRLPAVEE